VAIFEVPTYLTSLSYVLGSFCTSVVIKVTDSYLMNSDRWSQMFT